MHSPTKYGMILYNQEYQEGYITRKGRQIDDLFLSDPPGVRTQDPILKRDVLYLLS